MTVRAVGAARPGRDRRPGGRDRRPADRPFSVVDELNCYFDSPAEPNNVQLEAWLPGRLNPERLRAAVATVLADVPAARARRAGGGWWRAGYAWEVPPEADADPVSVTGWRTEAELGAARARFLAAAPALEYSPPFRLLLAQGPGWDSLILNAHHAAFDGRSCVRLLSLIAARYGDGHPREAPAAAVTVRPAATVRPSATVADTPAAAVTVRPAAAGAQTPAATGAGAPSPGSSGARCPSTAGEPRAARGSRPGARRGTGWNTARIAPRHAGGRAARGEPGYGLSLLEWPGVPAPPQPAGGSRVTVNDLLIAALIETITRWNTGRRRRPGRVQISMPVDTRPPGDAGELGNLSRLCTITVDPSRAADLTVAVAGQTRRAKSTPGPLVGQAQAAVAGTRLPVAIKRGLLRLALRSVGTIRCDTSLLSNLGNVTEPPAFGPLTPARMWFSTSAHMPRGLSVGAVTIGGRLNLCFRYRNALLDAASGRQFAAEYAAALSALAAGGIGR